MWRKRVTALFEVKLSISVKILSTVINGRGLKIQYEDYQVYRCIDKNHNCFKQYHITVKTKQLIYQTSLSGEIVIFLCTNTNMIFVNVTIFL